MARLNCNVSHVIRSAGDPFGIVEHLAQLIERLPQTGACTRFIVIRPEQRRRDTLRVCTRSPSTAKKANSAAHFVTFKGGYRAFVLCNLKLAKKA